MTKRKNSIGEPGSLDGPPINLEESWAYKAGKILGGVIAGAILGAVAILVVIGIVWAGRGLNHLIQITF